MKKKAKLEPVEDLNLVPIMNLVVCLIPMVLAGAALVKVGVVNVNMKSFGPPVEVVEPRPDPLDLTLAVGHDGFRIKANADLGEDRPGTETLLPKAGADYDYVALYNTLSRIKARYPEETVIQLTADPDVPYKHLMGVMDVIRFKLSSESFADLSALQAADVALRDGRPELLWHDVVFAVAM